MQLDGISTVCRKSPYRLVKVSKATNELSLADYAEFFIGGNKIHSLQFVQQLSRISKTTTFITLLIIKL